MIEVIVLGTDWARVEFGFVTTNNPDGYGLQEGEAEELANVLEKYFNEKEERWKEFRGEIWKQVDGFMSRGGNVVIQIFDFPTYVLDENDFVGFKSDWRKSFACVKWWLEDIYEISHKSEPFLVFENHYVDELTELVEE